MMTDTYTSKFNLSTLEFRVDYARRVLRLEIVAPWFVQTRCGEIVKRDNPDDDEFYYRFLEVRRNIENIQPDCGATLFDVPEYDNEILLKQLGLSVHASLKAHQRLSKVEAAIAKTIGAIGELQSTMPAAVEGAVAAAAARYAAAADGGASPSKAAAAAANGGGLHRAPPKLPPLERPPAAADALDSTASRRRQRRLKTEPNLLKAGAAPPQ